MENIELRANKAGKALGERLRGEVQPFQYHEVASRIFTAKFLLVNKSHSITIPDDISWERISSSHYDIGNLIDELFYKTVHNNGFNMESLSNFSLSKIGDHILYDCLMIIDQSSLTIEEFQDTNLTGRYFLQLIQRFMESEGKELGTSVTPEGLNRLMIEILNPSNGCVFDGAAGIGGSLIEAYRFNNDISMFGQEINESNVALAYMNAIINGIDLSRFQIAKGDTLFSPAFIKNDSNLMQFDYIAMNQPFGLKLNNIQMMDYDPYGRFSGRMGKTSKMHGDLAFLQHTVSSLNETGRAAVIVPLGVLSRSSHAERAFREYIVNNDMIETIVLLPNKLFSYTAIQTVLLVLNKNKQSSRMQQVLFINAEEQFTSRGRSQNYLTQDNIDSIIAMNEQSSTDTEDVKIATLPEIIESEFNLNPNHYFTSQTVDTQFGEVIINKAVYDDKVKNKRTLKEVAELSRGVNLPSKNTIKEGQKGYKVIQLKDVENGKIDLESVEVIPVKNADRYLVESGDIIIASRGTAYKVAIVPDHNETLVLSNMFIRIRIKDKAYKPEYIKVFLDSPVGVALIEGMKKGGTVKALTTQDIEDIEFPDIELNEQEEIIRTVKDAELKYMELLQQAHDVLKESKLNAYTKMGLRDVIKGLD
ncbi:N-6 DNA methylase [Ornithinibacillus sp. L9]|uniref:site-specific DNA-methyltransferase (adenine-specific) n=1 Tax=Ornithinibacillus caprae TaxID=2678566 RepID=A0A6N8FG60_9BACI|nr:N-6 DNA methylase [Ornithinibacillus caprae]MUK88201.1 N-6 DNA methylase [Ornithinibacillus caprae]